MNRRFMLVQSSAPSVSYIILAKPSSTSTLDPEFSIGQRKVEACAAEKHSRIQIITFTSTGEHSLGPDLISATTGILCYAECHGHSAKGRKPLAKPLASVPLGKSHPTYTSSANRSLPRARVWTLGKDFAESQTVPLGKIK